MNDPDPLADERTALRDAVTEDGAIANLLLAWRRGTGDYEVCRVQMADELADHFLELTRVQAANLANERMRIEYDPEWPLKSHEFFAIENDPPVGGNLFELLADYTNVSFFDRKDLTKPRLYVVAVHTSKGIAFFGKRMGQGLTVLSRRKRGLVSAVFDGSTFSTLEQSVATFSTSFDWVAWPGATRVVFVLSARDFHAEFRDVPALLAAVEAGVATIRAHIEIENFEKLVERCQRSVPMASKLRHVVEHGIVDRSIASLKTYAIAYDISVTWNGEALVFDESIEGQWAILKLLDEDRTEGPVSGRHYESSAKGQV